MREFNGRDRFWGMARHHAVAHVEAQLGRVAELVESPLEEVAVVGLYMAATPSCAFSVFSWSELSEVFVVGADLLRADPVSICVTLQYPHKNYRVDLAVVAADENDDRAMVFVELDGHEFHEKTKEQAAADKKRQRELAKGGTTIFRFTGSEVFRDPESRMREVVDEVVTQLRRKT